MRLKVLYMILMSVFIAGCMFAVMSNKAKTSPAAMTVSPTQAQQSPSPALEKNLPLHQILNESFLKQMVVAGTVILLMLMILKSSRPR